MHKKSNTLLYIVKQVGEEYRIFSNGTPISESYRHYSNASRACKKLERQAIQTGKRGKLIQAYHMIGLDSVDLFRLKSGKITEDDLAQKQARLFQKIQGDGKLLTSHQVESVSRQFHLDRLVGDNQYIFLSLGKRYWNEPEASNFGFLFDAEELLHEGAILRDGDFLSIYEDILHDVVRSFAPDRREDQWSQQELATMMAALSDPHADYVSPNDDYYNLLDDVEHQQIDAPLCKEATEAFLQQVKAFQSEHQWEGGKAIERARKEGETGRYEILVKGELPIAKAMGTVENGIIKQ